MALTLSPNPSPKWIEDPFHDDSNTLGSRHWCVPGLSFVALGVELASMVRVLPPSPVLNLGPRDPWIAKSWNLPRDVSARISRDPPTRRLDDGSVAVGRREELKGINEPQAERTTLPLHDVVLHPSIDGVSSCLGPRGTSP